MMIGMPIIEHNRRIYAFDKNQYGSQDLLLLVQQGVEGHPDPNWTPLSLGWEYQLWSIIGERGGLAEAQELQLLNGELTIEEYVQLYREELKNIHPIQEIFDAFELLIRFSLNEKETCEYSLQKYQTLIKENDFVLVDADQRIYEKVLMSGEVEILKRVGYEEMIFLPRKTIVVPNPGKELEQLSLF
ncbi:hypothetical protein [Ammoniphilus resinae]|uniref:Uncharacterized protein n=1 Tax=Ammoniphilus resinae TaxID=861532 RepID=A0ABS4GNX8_9BACL|nr:hypothetical protein [Ammoniphilus resinae]MBP1931762.1 hypothetical protein [Ammoniphilus resinae]